MSDEQSDRTPSQMSVGSGRCTYPECGTQNEPTSQFCRACGRSLVTAYGGPPPAGMQPPFDQPLTRADEAAPPVVPPPGQYPEGFATIHDKPKKLWTVGTLVYTTGGLMVLFFWLLFGDFAISLRDRSVGNLMQLMLKSFQANNVTMAVLLSMIPTAITLVLSPVISYKSDRLRSRWGRRIPYLLIPTPIAALAMIGLAFCPQMATGLEALTGHAIGRKAALLTTFAVFWTLFEIAVVVAGSVFNGLINDVVPRAVLGRFFALFRAISLIDGMIFNFLIIGHAEEHFTLICSGIALVFGVGFTLMCLMVKEGDYPSEPGDAADHRAGGFLPACKVYVRECFSQTHYLWIFAAFTLTALAANPINSWAIVYAKDLGLKIQAWDPNGPGFGAYRLGWGGVLGFTYFCSLILAYPIGSLVDRFHPLRVAMAAMTLYGVSCLIGYTVVRDATSFGWALLAHGVLSGCYFTASAALAQVLLPRLRFTQFASAGVVVTQIATLIYTPILGAVLDATGSNYRITFLLSGVFALLSLFLLLSIYRRFMAMGGPTGYIAPLPAAPATPAFEVQPLSPRH